MRNLLIIGYILCTSLSTFAQRMTPEQYVNQYKDYAISEMKRVGVPAAITLAQGILETESGNSDLVKRSNNHFGIKCKNTWTGNVVYHDDDESGECFRAYPSAEESFRDHSNFLRGSSRYGFLFSLDAADYKGWARGLKKAGYATNPKYPDILIRNIEQYNLQQYTLAGLNPAGDTGLAKETGRDTMMVARTETAFSTDTDSNTSSLVDQPLKLLTINGSKCVYAAKGTSLLLIATRNQVNLGKMLAYNELAEDGVLGKAQYVFLEKKSRTGEREDHLVQPGESYYDIAQKNGIQLQYLLDYNKLDGEGRPEAGTSLLLRPGKAEASSGSPKWRYYEVAPREGLFSIAKKFNVSVQQLRQWNQLDADEIKAGQKLIVAK